MKSIIKLLLRLIQFACFGICLIPYTSAHKSSEVDYWKLMGIDGPFLEWVPCMPGATVQGYPILSRNVPLGTGTYYMPVGLSIHPNKNRVSPLPRAWAQGLMAHPAGKQGSRSASTPHENTRWPQG